MAERSPDDPLNPEFLRKLEYLRVVARKVHTGRFSALQRSRKLGRGIDFADHRPYTPGDDFKDIDWNLYGRLDRFMVRLAEEETELNLYLLVDCSKSMSAQKATFVRQVATALSYVALAHLDRVHIYPFGDGLLRPFSPNRHKAQAVQVYRWLEAADPSGATDIEASCKAFASVVRGRGIVLVLSDFLAPGGWQRGLDLLRHGRFEVGIMQVSDPDEAEAPAKGEVLLADRETGAVRRLRITEGIAAAYRKAFLAHGQRLQDYGRSHNLFYAHGRTDHPFEEMVLHTMRSERLLA
ncbi:MAG: DUF58 domain-containing protein [Deltaproteobacteria bacterium]|nr:DUF58 domain-containing protein [Deltaproteobacteria bacterium]